jgi:RNA polymerase sigma-70 factor (ECF subfamily)
MDILRGRQRRARPMELGPSLPPVDSSVQQMLPEGSWVSPIADERVLPLEADPAEVALARDSIRLAFVAALQHLPPRQRAVLILCEVLRWQASEAAQLLETSVPAVNSALQRARARLASAGVSLSDMGQAAVDADQRDLLARYVDAFERYDMDSLVRVLHEDAIHTMPPFAMWLRSSQDITRFMLGPGHGCRGSRLIPVAANASPAFAQYKPDPESGKLRPWAIMVLDVSGDRVTGIHSFLEIPPAKPEFPVFGLPAQLP